LQVIYYSILSVIKLLLITEKLCFLIIHANMIFVSSHWWTK